MLPPSCRPKSLNARFVASVTAACSHGTFNVNPDALNVVRSVTIFCWKHLF